MTSNGDQRTPLERGGGSSMGEMRALLDGLVTSHFQVVQQERLRAFREMAGEVAHDFNNTLSGILARAQLLLADVQDPDVRRSLRMIEQVALEGAWVVRRFQDFSRSRPARPFQPVDLNQLVDEIAASARSRRATWPSFARCSPRLPSTRSTRCRREATSRSGPEPRAGACTARLPTPA